MDNAFRNIYVNPDGSFTLDVETSRGSELIHISAEAAETIAAFLVENN